VASSLVKSFLKGLEESGEAARVCTLTYQDIFFSRLGFQVVKKDLFPQKIWSDCWICPKKDCCDEIAMLLDLNGYHQK
jgi:amino-acid N-acetyltransferase